MSESSRERLTAELREELLEHIHGEDDLGLVMAAEALGVVSDPYDELNQLLTAES